MYDADAVVRIHASALNAHDMESFINQYTSMARLIRDGQVIAEGRDAVAKGLEADQQPGGYVQVRHLDGEPVIAECHGNPENPEYDGIIRLHHVGDMLDEARIDHDPQLLRRLQA